ncbi:MAG TPA: hypothetical protein VGG53_09380 [Mycobacterium sp.]|jgi:hypothetical protein|uniref:hypothetical protein n=1 Tax=Mycobacterium sp. TaxID=1785 RepID=UPI002F42C010
MKDWIRRNGRALLISLLMTELIGITIILPAWREHIGYQKPKHTVPYGQSIVLGGIRWQLTLVKPPDPHELRGDDSYLPENIYDLSPNTRLATYLFQRTQDGKPASLPDGFSVCSSSANAGNQQWTKQSYSLGITEWQLQRNVTTICSPKYREPLLQAFIVPKDVHITSVDVQFLPTSWDNSKQLSKATDLLVIRFDTG